MISRRHLLCAGAAVSAAAVLPELARASGGASAPEAEFAPQPGAWRTFQVVTRLEILDPAGPTQAWVPLPAFAAQEWFKPLGNRWTTNAALVESVTDGAGAEMLHVRWNAGEAPPVVEVTSRISTRDRAVDLSKPGDLMPLSGVERAKYLAATDFIPVDGIVKATSDKITAGAGGDLARTRAIYEWVVENTFREAATRGCGTGNVAAMLESGRLGGKCADINALFVGLVRAAGIPARDVYGVRVAPSRFGYKSLGANSEIVTKAQHCRAEVYLSGFGWVPVDPADVRKVALEEPPGNLALDSGKVKAARSGLFGAWEGNWLAYNTAHDVRLPGSDGPRLAFLMYPQAETAAGRLDCLDPDTFRYSLRASELAA